MGKNVPFSLSRFISLWKGVKNVMIIAIFSEMWSLIVILHAECNAQFGFVIGATSMMFVSSLGNVEQYWTVQLLWQHKFNHIGMIVDRIVKINISHLCAFGFLISSMLLIPTMFLLTSRFSHYPKVDIEYWVSYYFKGGVGREHPSLDPSLSFIRPLLWRRHVLYFWAWPGLDQACLLEMCH